MTHDCDLKEHHYGTMTVAFSERERRQKGEILAAKKKQSACSLVQTIKGLYGNYYTGQESRNMFYCLLALSRRG